MNLHFFLYSYSSSWIIYDLGIYAGSVHLDLCSYPFSFKSTSMDVIFLCSGYSLCLDSPMIHSQSSRCMFFILEN